MRFLTEAEPARGVALPVAPGVRRMVAANPGPMTYHGTNTYLLDWADGVAVLDPGPDDPGHVASVLAAAGGTVRAILLTHGHRDHYGALAAMRAATRTPVFAWRDGAHQPDTALADGDMAGPFQAVFTPGHAPDHLCFAGPDGVVFSGDHVMGWSTTVVGGNGGDMAAYMRSLELLLARPAQLFLPGHGPAIPSPGQHVAALLAHRREREALILSFVDSAPRTVAAITGRVYPGLHDRLRAAAEANVVAHLRKLEAEGQVSRTGETWSRELAG